jgi:hypothetical protein
MSLNINTNRFDNELKQETKKKPEEEEPAPLLFVDVNLGDEEQERIVVFEGDTPEQLAA